MNEEHSGLALLNQDGTPQKKPEAAAPEAPAEAAKTEETKTEPEVK